MMNCQRFQDKLADYVAERLTAKDAETVRQHLAGCRTCGQAEREERQLRALFAQTPLPLETADIWPTLRAQLNPPKRRAPLWRPWLVGSGFVTAGVAAALLFFATPSAQRPPDSHKEVKGTQEIVKADSPSPIPGLREIDQTPEAENDLLFEETQPARQIGLFEKEEVEEL